MTIQVTCCTGVIEPKRVEGFAKTTYCCMECGLNFQMTDENLAKVFALVEEAKVTEVSLRLLCSSPHRMETSS